MVEPVEWTNVLTLKGMGGSIPLRPHGTAESGLIYSAIDGDRFYYGNYGNDVVYIQIGANMKGANRLGKVYHQSKGYFANDIVVGGLSGEMNKRMAGSKAVIEGFMDVFLGVLSVTSGPVAIGITGMNLLVATGKLKQDYTVYSKAMEVLLYHRSWIANNAKILYNVVLLELLIGELEKTLSGQAKEALLKAVPGPKVAGKVVGVFLGKIGEDRLKVRMKAVNELFKDVLIKVADHAAANWPEKLSRDQVESLARLYVRPILNKPGLLDIPQSVAEQIVQDVVDNCLGLQNPLKKISAAFDKII